jgi:hypothetical protein
MCGPNHSLSLYRYQKLRFKSQIPNKPKPKSQITKTIFLRKIEYWSLFVVWCLEIDAYQAALVTNPDRRHLEQILTRAVFPFTEAFILWRLGYQTLRVLLLA